MKGTKNFMANIENTPRSRKSKKYHSRDEKRVENERENSHAENFTQDIIESSQPFLVVPKKKHRLDNCNSEKCTVGSLTTEFLEPAVSSGEPRFKKLSLNSLEPCVELVENKSSGNYLSKSVKTKDRKKRRIPSIVDSESHSNRDYDIIIVDEEPNYQTHEDEDRKKSKSKSKHRSSWDMSFPDFLSPIEIQLTDDAETKSEMSKKDRKRKRRRQVEEKIAKTPPTMIPDSGSSSDDETQETNDCSIAILNKGNTREHNTSKESYSHNTKHFRKYIPIPNSDKTSDNDRSKGLENDRDCCHDHEQSFEFVRTIRSEKWPAEIASNCSSPNISVEDLKIEPDVIRKDRKHKSEEKVKKKEANTLLAMIHDIRSSSDSDDEIKKIDDCSVDTPNKGNTRKRNKSRVSHTLSTSEKDKESPFSKTKGVKRLISSSRSNKSSDNYRLESRKSDQEFSQDEKQGFEFVRVMKSEELPADTASDCDSPNILVEHVKTEPDVIGKYRKHKAQDKVEKKKANTLLTMIHDSGNSSDSDDEIKKIDDCSVETLNKRNSRKCNKSRLSQISSTSFKEEESHPPTTNHFRKFIPNPKRNETSDSDRSKGLENDRDCCQDNQQGFEFVRAIRSEKFPADIASNCSSPNISFDDLKMKPDVMREDRKHGAKEKVDKKKTDTLLAIIHDIRSSSDSDDEIQKIDDCSITILNKGNTREHNKSRLGQILSTSFKEKESDSSNKKYFRKFIPIPNNDKTSDSNRSKGLENDRDCQDHQQDFEFVKAIRSEKLPAHRASNYSSPYISVDDLKMKPDVIREDRKHGDKKKVKKKNANTLLTMIHDIRSSSDSDDEIKKIDDCSVETLNKGNTRKRNKSRVSQILSTSSEEEESHSSNTKHFRKFIKNPKSAKTSDNDRSKDRENCDDSPQDNQQGFELVKAIKSEKLSADTVSNCTSPDISVEDLKTKPDVISKDRKHKSKKKVVKKKANTLLALTHDTSISSDSDDEIKKIDDSSDESMDKVNSRKSTKSRVSETFKEEEEHEGASEQPVENSSAISQKFDLEVEAEDIEELISAIEEREQIPHETVTRLLELRIRLKHTVPPQHRIETHAGSRAPTPRQKEIIETFGPIKYGKFTPEEDDIIVNNWQSFCELHDWDPTDVKPFLYMRHQRIGLIAKFSERLKFVRFLADGLPWRTLYSVYWRFRNLYQPHILYKYTEDEDKLIITHLESSSDRKNIRKYSELGKILNRTRDSVRKRHQLLNKRRNPYEKLEWNLDLVKKVIKNLMKLTLSNDVSQLKDLDIPLVVWKKLSDKFKIDDTRLKQFWQRKLHMQLFCQEPVYLNDVKIKLIEYFHGMGISESWEIEWPIVVKNFDGMTTAFLSRIFSSLIRYEKYEGIKFSEIIEYLYEVKKPELQENLKDKCLPRIVFKDGNVELLDVNDDNMSVKSEDLSD